MVSLGCRCVAFYVYVPCPLTGLGNVIGCQHSQQQFHGHAKGLFQPERHIGIQSRFAIDDIGERWPAHFDQLGRFGNAQVQRLQDLDTDELSRRCRHHPHLDRFFLHQ